MSGEVLIIGGGIAGMETALRLDQSGVKAHIVEQDEDIGGHAVSYCCKATDRCHKCYACLVNDRVYQVKTRPSIAVYTGASISSISHGEGFKVRLSNQPEEIKVDALVLATGFVPYDPIEKGTFGYGQYLNVISAIDLESNLAGDGTHGLRLPSNGEVARDVAFIQCVGSRYDLVEEDSHSNIYCSRVCCGYALRMANLILERAPETKISFFFMDLQHFGKNFDEFVDTCAGNDNFEFVRGIPSGILERDGKLILRFEDFAEGGVKNRGFDAVVLSVGMRPRKENQSLAQMLNIGLDRFGFFAGSGNGNAVCERIYRVGSCGGPKDIGQCLNEAATVSVEVVRFLEKV